MVEKQKYLIGFLILSILLAACTLSPANAPTATTPDAPENTTAPLVEAAPTETQSLSTSLPSALYLLSIGDNNLMQVFRISQDRSTTAQLTAEPENVEEFAVNPVNGQIAYITNNQIYLINADTTGRTLLVDASQADRDTDDYFFRQRINGLSWSNDGSQLVYGQNGLNLLTLANNTSEKIIENELDEQENGFVFPRAIYTPMEWSPDGSLMMIDIGFYEAGSIGVYSTNTGQVIQLGEGIVCCHPTWSPDSRSIVIASPYFGMVPSGLWRYDAQTGGGVELISSSTENNTFNFAGWPLALPNGQLQYFFGSTNDVANMDIPLAMVRSEQDGVSSRSILRLEEWDNYDALWSPDGRLVVLVVPPPGETPSTERIGPVVLVPVSEEGIILLEINGYQLQWGP